ncbi:MAG: family 16 glycosylhydrolase [Bacteroidales bacterium]|jgi:hypothetical protein|nr:family 16 glycosylhydrolase [Bacteroidales bacterium]
MSLLGLKVILGFFPNTGKVEKRRKKLMGDYQQYKEYSQSEELRRYEYLCRYLNSKEFKEMLDDPEADEQKINLLKQEFYEIQKSKALKHYFREKAAENRFAPITSWNMKLEDDFTGDRLNSDTWITRYYRGEKALGRNYTLWGDMQCNTDGDNLSVADSVLSIETRPEKTNGISWHPLVGFIPCEFPYTSGIVSTAKAFRFRYGKIEAKMKVPANKAAYHAFWLASDKALPQINIFTYEKGRFYMGNFWGKLKDTGGANSDVTAVTGAFAGKSYLFSLEWTKNRLTWTINGVTIKTMKFGIPSEPLYIAMASGVRKGRQTLSTPVKFEIDWIRYYQSSYSF